MILANRSFRLLLSAQAVSQLGDWLYNVALLAFVFERTHSPAWLAATTAARVLPVVLLGPVAGVLGDRYDRRFIMVLSDLIRVAAMLALVASVWLHLPIVIVPVLAAAATAAASPYPSCVAATIPRLLPREQLPAANSLRAAIGPCTIVAGPAIGAGVVALGGAAWAFAANALTFAVSAVLVLAISQTDAFRPAGVQSGERGLRAAVLSGARELRRRPAASRLVGADVLCSLSYGVQTVALVAVSMRLGWRESGYGVLLAAIGIGGIAGASLASRALRRVSRHTVMSAALATVGLSLPLVAALPSFAVVALVAATAGAGSMVVEVGTETVLQEELPDDVFARAYGFAFPASIAGIVIGSLLAAPLTALVGLPAALTVVGALILGYAGWLFAAARPVAPVAAVSMG